MPSILKNHLKQAVPSSLIVEIEDDIIGLNDVTIVDIPDHVQQHRGKINDNLIDKKKAQFREPFGVSQGMSTFICHIEEC